MKGTASNEEINYFTNYGFHIHYDQKTKLVNFIEIMYDMQTVFELYEKNPFTTDVEEMITILNDRNGSEINLIDAPASYLFLDLSLGIFRTSTPENMKKYVAQLKIESPESFVDGKPAEWLQLEIDASKHFQTIGLGNTDYFRNPIYSVKESNSF